MTTPTPPPITTCRGPGYEQLWSWFGIGREAWLTLPRSFMHEMPDAWQAAMTELLKQWDAHWNTSDLPGTRISGVTASGVLTKLPEYVTQYRNPDRAAIHAHRTAGAGADQCQQPLTETQALVNRAQHQPTAQQGNSPCSQ